MEGRQGQDEADRREGNTRWGGEGGRDGERRWPTLLTSSFQLPVFTLLTEDDDGMGEMVADTVD